MSAMVNEDVTSKTYIQNSCSYLDWVEFMTMLLYIQHRKDSMVILPWFAWFLQLVCILQWSLKTKQMLHKNNYTCPFKARHALPFWEQHSLLGFFWLLILILHFDSFMYWPYCISPLPSVDWKFLVNIRGKVFGRISKNNIFFNWNLFS